MSKLEELYTRACEKLDRESGSNGRWYAEAMPEMSRKNLR